MSMEAVLIEVSPISTDIAWQNQKVVVRQSSIVPGVKKCLCIQSIFKRFGFEYIHRCIVVQKLLAREKLPWVVCGIAVGKRHCEKGDITLKNRLLW